MISLSIKVIKGAKFLFYNSITDLPYSLNKCCVNIYKKQRIIIKKKKKIFINHKNISIEKKKNFFFIPIII
jgi:hypothetical protein